MEKKAKGGEAGGSGASKSSGVRLVGGADALRAARQVMSVESVCVWVMRFCTFERERAMCGVRGDR